jgi:uncharacterized protein YndB with AHSA1/START domain
VEKRWTIDVYRHVDAPVETVWEIISNHRAYPLWTSMRTARLEQEGSPHPDGIGAIRFLGVGPIGAREQMLDFDPPHHLAYTILSGPPVRGYRADMVLSPTSDGGTDLRWTGGFDSAPPGAGRACRAVLERALRTMGDAIVAEGARRARLVSPSS